LLYNLEVTDLQDKNILTKFIILSD